MIRIIVLGLTVIFSSHPLIILTSPPPPPSSYPLIIPTAGGETSSSSEGYHSDVPPALRPGVTQTMRVLPRGLNQIGRGAPSASSGRGAPPASSGRGAQPTPSRAGVISTQTETNTKNYANAHIPIDARGIMKSDLINPRMNAKKL